MLATLIKWSSAYSVHLETNEILLFRPHFKVNAFFYTKRLVLKPYNKVGKPYLAFELSSYKA